MPLSTPLSDPLDMWTSHTAMFLAVWPFLVNAESNLHEYSNGWVPVSSELVHKQLARVGAPSSQYTAQGIQLLHTYINNQVPLHVLNTPGDIDVNKEEVGNIGVCRDEDINCNQESTHTNFVSNLIDQSSNPNKTDNSVVRRSKKIDNLNLRNTQELFFPENSSPKNKERTYEVTEDTLELDEFNANYERYNYEPPKKKNQTNALFDILSKYKINKDDELENYLLSRKHKARITPTSIPFAEKHNQIFYRYNNLNHSPIDPVLAILLSNYGFCLRGINGAQNSYSNLYGYLVSNIHNNRPFGLYKIYSDTDSSH